MKKRNFEIKGKLNFVQKRIFILLFVMVFILCSLSACSNSESTTKTDDNKVEKSTSNKVAEEVTSEPISTETTTLEPTLTETAISESTPTEDITVQSNLSEPPSTISDIPAYSGSPYVAINDNNPYFTGTELTTSYEHYSELDSLGRCGVVYACVGKDMMPTEERGSIGHIKPTGWHSVKYDIVDGKYLYNRCHLIGYQLTGENSNERNLITGTRSMNVDGMLPFENMVADYVKETGNHVLYRVTPMFNGNNLLADGVLIEAKSVEDDGAGVLLNVFVYNVQAGVNIDYATGDSSLNGENLVQADEVTKAPVQTEKPIITEKPVQTEKIIATKAPVKTETPAITENSVIDNISTSVWISETGSKYHSKNNCGRMNPSKAKQMPIDSAISQGYSACSKCY